MTSLPVNGARGEVLVRLGGRSCRLCLTLGALAEMETALACSDLIELKDRLKHLSASSLTIVLSALLRGGGEEAMASRLSSIQLDIGDAARAVSECFGRAGA